MTVGEEIYGEWCRDPVRSRRSSEERRWLLVELINARWRMLFGDADPIAAARCVRAWADEVNRLRHALGRAAAEAHARCPGGGPFTECPHRHCRDAAEAWRLPEGSLAAMLQEPPGVRR